MTTYKLGINDNKFWRKDLLAIHLYRCFVNNEPTTLNVTPEGSCCEGNGVYRHLDAFCAETGYPKSMITINTGNMAERHPEYKITKDPRAWYEVPIIQDWVKQNPVDTGRTPTKHFGHFIGKSNWNRVWIGTILRTKYNDKLFQTFNSGLNSNYITKHDDMVDFVGLEDLVKHRCDILPEVIEFLKTCPHIIPEDIEFIKTCPVNIKQSDYYPIQLPANLNILKYYTDIFVDVVHETFVRGNLCFATEKTWRPIIARRPFISMAGRNHLANLRRLGFRTFNNIWDEGYDEYGMHHRIHEIEKLLEQISQWTPKQLVEKLAEMQDILDHNYAVFMSLTYSKIKETFSE